MFTHLLAFGLGAGAMYYGSETVKQNIKEIREDCEAIEASKERINQAFIKKCEEMRSKGRLEEFLAELDRQKKTLTLSYQ